jgi:hypothetical protein
VWVTNNYAIIDFVIQELLPAWGFSHVSTWWWIKIRPDTSPLHPLHSNHKKCYERIIIGYRSDNHNFSASRNDTYSNATNISSTNLNAKCATFHYYDGNQVKELSDTSAINCDTALPMMSIDDINCIKVSSLHSDSKDSSGVGDTVNEIKEENEFDFSPNVIVSVPSYHSWKPPLQPLLQTLIKSKVVITPPCHNTNTNQQYLNLNPCIGALSKHCEIESISTDNTSIPKSLSADFESNDKFQGTDLELFSRSVSCNSSYKNFYFNLAI